MTLTCYKRYGLSVSRRHAPHIEEWNKFTIINTVRWLWRARLPLGIWVVVACVVLTLLNRLPANQWFQHRIGDKSQGFTLISVSFQCCWSEWFCSRWLSSLENDGRVSLHDPEQVYSLSESTTPGIGYLVSDIDFLSVIRPSCSTQCVVVCTCVQ